MLEIQALVIQGEQWSQQVVFASATLLLYDHIVNLTDEVEHFWSGPWTLSRGLYLCIRYLGFVQVVIMFLSYYVNTLVCPLPIAATLMVTVYYPIQSPVVRMFMIYGGSIVVTVLCQAVITIRVWYLFTHSSTIRIVAATAFVASLLAVALLSGFLWGSIRAAIPGTSAKIIHTPVIAWLYAPSLFLHSLLFALKVYRFVTSPKYLKRDTFLWRFLKEGMVMYACALASLLFIVIGLTATNTAHIPLYEIALISAPNIFVALMVISVCHAMLSIKSLATIMHVDPGWLLNHAELSRVHWRPGMAEGEIVVEMLNDSYELPIMSSSPKDAPSSRSQASLYYQLNTSAPSHA